VAVCKLVAQNTLLYSFLSLLTGQTIHIFKAFGIVGASEGTNEGSGHWGLIVLYFALAGVAGIMRYQVGGYEHMFEQIDDAKRSLRKLAIRLSSTPDASTEKDTKSSQIDGAQRIFGIYDSDGSADLSRAEFDKLLLENGVVTPKAVSHYIFAESVASRCICCAAGTLSKDTFVLYVASIDPNPDIHGKNCWILMKMLCTTLFWATLCAMTALVLLIVNELVLGKIHWLHEFAITLVWFGSTSGVIIVVEHELEAAVAFSVGLVALQKAVDRHAGPAAKITAVQIGKGGVTKLMI
jgi:hypothetical protein